MATTSPTPSADWEEVERSEEFRALRSRHSRFVFPLSAAFIIWYFGYVLLAAYATDFMATPVFGAVNVGLLLGLGQFVTTFAITAWYVNHANKVFDPAAEALYDKIESGSI
ncbi:uncharacterized membrane protein (DUF485 family) [Microbacteriaceae bacterium MWH-Ta3]|nr:uncharacterized membrane protein (DUF485 family) [Microbacteriaceae bacterium MWH-Ta3]